MRRSTLDDLNNKLAVDNKPKGTQEQVESVSGDNAPDNSFTGSKPVATAPSSVQTQQAKTPQRVKKPIIPAEVSEVVKKATTKNAFAEENKDGSTRINPDDLLGKNTIQKTSMIMQEEKKNNPSANNVEAETQQPTQQGFNISEPKREEFDTYEKQINFLTPPETEEERLAREKKERSSKNLSALFDGLTALYNIYHTTQYAPPQTLTSGTEKMTQKYDKLKENADKIKKEYQNAILKLRQLDDADYQNAWNRWFALRKQYENGEISKQQLQQRIKEFNWKVGNEEAKAEAEEKRHKDKMDLTKSEGEKNRAVQGAKNGGNGDLNNLSSHSHSVSLPENTAIDYALIYKQLVNSYANGNKALSPSMLGLQVNDKGQITAREKNPDKIKKIALLHFGASKESLAYMRELEKNPNMKEYEKKKTVQGGSPDKNTKKKTGI